MQRDKRIGLALAILLMGFATAFCFRPDQGEMFSSPQLEDPGIIDSQLASQHNTPYLKSLEEEPVPKTSETGGSTLISEPQISFSEIEPDLPESGREPFNLIKDKTGLEEELFADIDRIQSNSSSIGKSKTDRLSSAPLAAPDPIGFDEILEEATPVADRDKDQEDSIWKSVTDTRSLDNRDDLEERLMELEEEELPVQHLTGKPQKQIIHTVKPGDMLSTISRKYLGSSARYNEIYEANRDILSSPHNLQVGMKLKIPGSSSQGSSIAGREFRTSRKKQSVADETDNRIPSKKVSQSQIDYEGEEKSNVNAPEPRSMTKRHSSKFIPMKRNSPQKYERSNMHLEELLSNNPDQFEQVKNRNYKVVEKEEETDQVKE